MFSSELPDAESQYRKNMQCRFQESHGLVTLLPERSCFPRGTQLKHFGAGSAIRSAYSPIAGFEASGPRGGQAGLSEATGLYKRSYSPLNPFYARVHPAYN